MRVAVRVAMRVAVVVAPAVAVVVTKDTHEDKIHDNANGRDDKHHLALHDFRRDQTEHCLVEQDAGHGPDDKDANYSTQHLSAVKAKAVLRVGLATRQCESKDAHKEPGDIREHVCGIRHHS